MLHMIEQLHFSSTLQFLNHLFTSVGTVLRQLTTSINDIDVLVHAEVFAQGNDLSSRVLRG